MMKSKRIKPGTRILFAIACTIPLIIGTSCKTNVESSDCQEPSPKVNSKFALNAYSFNANLREGSMDVFDLLEYCSEIGIKAVDITGYYFPGYPEPPSDEYINSVKKRAFELGIHICGTGIRNDFCNPDPAVREQDQEFIREWLIVAQKLGAPAIRILQGPKISTDYTWDEIAGWAAEEIKKSADVAKSYGVVLEIQNHNNFLKTAEEVNKFMAMVNHEWVGLMLDVGSYRTPDPYVDIEETIKHAISWQVKEDVFMNQERTPLDIPRLKNIVAGSDYKGYLPIESLGKGDPYVKVDSFHQELIAVFR